MTSEYTCPSFRAIAGSAWLFVLALCVALVAPLHAQDGGPIGGLSPVGYNPNNLQPVQGMAPLSTSYVLSITSPSALPLGSTVVTLTSTVLSAPAGTSSATAASFLTLSQSSLTYTGPNQTLTVTVNLNVPSGTEQGAFSYFITTAGWPAGFNIQNNGTYVNLTVNPPSTVAPVAVSIDTPADGTVLHHISGQPPLQVPIQVTGQSSDGTPITVLTATLSGVDQSGTTILSGDIGWGTPAGLGSMQAVGSLLFTVPSPGVYTITAVTQNNLGVSATATSTFTVTEQVAPPTVTITIPPDPTYDYYQGSTPLHIPYVFQGQSFAGGIATLTATLNGTPVTFSSTDLGLAIASGTGAFDLSTPGDYTLVVTATDNVGTATASTTFHINLIVPTPTIAINDPANNSSFNHIIGTPGLSIPFTFTTTVNSGFVVTAESAMLDGVSLPVTSIIGLNTTTAIGGGTMTGVLAGTHTLTAYGTAGGMPVSTSILFTVVDIPSVTTPPVVVITSPAPGSTYTMTGTCTKSAAVPLVFVGTSTTTGAVITKLSATLDGAPVTISTANLNTKSATGSATVNVTVAGAHTFKVTATDAYGTATASTTFLVINPTQKYTLSGTVFFDANFNGIRETEDYGLSGVTVRALDSAGHTITSAATNSSGGYTLSVLPGTYIIAVDPVLGMSLTTLNDNSVTVTVSNGTAPDVGYGLRWSSINGLCANGFTIGYWKNNIGKALQGKCSGTQVNASTLKSYTTAIGSLALDPFTGLTMSQATATMGSTSSDPASLLAKQLLASEYNYANGAYLGGSRTLTYAFIYYGEYVLKHSANYSSSYILFVQTWCNAYNNTHGGAINGPLP